jgi:uncharacterized protein
MDDSKLTHGTFSWNELMTTDTAAAKEFYGKLFGWQTEDRPMGEFDYTILKTGALQVGGLMPIPSQAKGTPPCWNSFVTVDNIDETAKKAQELGGALIVPPRDIPDVGRFAVIRDPQGAVISAITYLKK